MDITINAGESRTYDGVTYTATSNAVLNLDDAGKVSGIASGSVTATIDGASDSPEIIFDGTKAFEFTCAKSSISLTDTDIIKVGYQNSSISYASGSVTYSGTGVAFPAGDIGLAGTIKNIVPFNINMTVPDSGATVIFNEDGNVNLKSAETLTTAVTFPVQIKTLLENLKGVLPMFLKIPEGSFEELYNFVTQLVSSTTTIALSGEAIYNRDAKTFSFAEGGTLDLNILKYGIKLTAVDGAIDGISLYYSKDGDNTNAGVKIVPNSGNGKLGVDITEDGKSIFKDVIQVTSGMLTLDPINSKFSADANTSFTIHVREVYVATLASTDAINVGLSADGSGNISLTLDAVPFTFTLQRDDITVFSGKFLVSGGSLVFNGDAHSLTMTQGTTATVTYGEYEMSLTANEAAGMEIVANENGTYSFTPGENDGALDISLNQNGTTVFSGTLNVTGGTISFDPETQEISLTEGTTTTVTYGEYEMSLTANGTAGMKIAANENGTYSFTPVENDGSLHISLNQNDTPIFGGTLNVTGGTVSFNPGTQEFTSTKGTKFSFSLDTDNQPQLLMAANSQQQLLSTTSNQRQIDMEVVDGSISVKVAMDADGNLLITTSENDGKLEISLGKDGETTFQNNLSINGSMIFNPVTKLLTLVDGTTVNVAFDNYTLTATADGDASSEISLSASGIAITPQTGDGKLNLTLTGTSSGSLSAKIELLSGGFFFGLDDTLSVMEGTELKIDFGNGYIVNFKATDDAGGSISLGADGITFAPNSDDGGLELSITRDGETRSASLDVTGSVTYKLDGSISLAQGTVVRNVFEDGNILTITANTAASGSIVFNPQTGLTITPSSADALKVVLSTGDLDVVNVSSITGSITYSGGVITASDGTKAHISYYFGWESELYTTGGSATIQFTDDRTIYTALDGATFTVDYLDGTTTEIQHGSYADVYGENIEDYVELVSEGTLLRSNDAEIVFTLEKAGNYTLNGMNIITTKDNVEVMLPDYNTISFDADAGITFEGQEFSGSGTVTITDGNITIENIDDNATVNGTAFNDSITNSGESVTINASAGNDTITGFNETTTLSVGDNIYSTQQSGDDLIITVGESKITLVGAASLSAPNIKSTNSIVTLAETILKRTALGYPVMAAIAFHPEEYDGDEPTNYSDKEDWTITSADNLELHAVHYTPENSNDKWVVIVHGYGHNHKHMYPFATSYLANGYNVLMIDQRTAGDSEGTWLTMGAAEGADVALWTQEIARRNSNAKITLHGVSMGSATAMLAAARSDAVNVTSLVEDCGYTSAMNVFYLLNEAIVNAPTEVIAALDLVGEGMTGYYLHDAAPINSISSAKMPTLFISGDADTVVPISMLTSLYEASGAEVKEEFIVEGVGHGRAGLEDPIGYSNAVFRFVAEADEEGWNTANTTDNISLRGTKYNDTIANSGDGVTINTGAGDDLIQVDGDNVRIEYTAGNDTVTGFNESTALQISGDYATATSGDNVVVTVEENTITLTDAASLDAINVYNDTIAQTINNTVDNVLVSGGANNDSIFNIGDFVTINALGGADSITNYGAGAIVDGGLDNDIIENSYAKNATIIGGSGNDSVYNSESNNVSISAGAGNDTILNEHAYYPTIEGGTGDDSIIIRRGHYSYIDGGAGNDSILGEAATTSGSWAMGGYATINGGSGNDYINPETSDSASINGGEGNDTIITSGNDSTLNGGAGDDIISLHGASVDNNIIEYESGNDIIYGLNATGTISLSAGAEYSTVQSGDDVILTVGENTITVAGAALVNVINYELTGSEIENTVSNTLVSGTRFEDTIDNEGSNVTIDAQAGNDVIQNHGANSSVNGGTGADSITNMDANSSTIEGEYGDDVLWNNADNVLINGNYGNDTLYNSGANATLSPGGGNDSIVNDGGASAVIDYSGGNDTISGFNETSTLQIGGGSYSTFEGLKDVAVFHDNYFAVLEDAVLTTDSININGEAIALSKFISLQGDSDSVEISRSNVTVDAGDGENLITFTNSANSNNIVLSGNTTVENFKTGFGEGSDTIYINGDPAGVDLKASGITFANSTDSLTFSDITTTAKINIYHERRQVLNKGVFIAGDDWYSVESGDLSVGSGEEVYFVGSTSTANHGVDFGGISSALNVTMDTAYEDSEDFVPGTTTWINSVYSLKGGAGNTTITGSKNSDTIIAGTGETTINAAAGDDVISLGSASALVQYSSGEGADTISGFNENSTLSINGSYSTTTSGDDIIVNVGDEAITIAGGAALETVNIIGETANEVSVDQIKQSLGADSIKTVTRNTYKVDNDDGNNLVYVDKTARGAKEITLGKGGDAVFVEASKGANVTVTGGAGNDSLFSGGTAPITFDMSKGGADKIYARFNGENISLKGYKASNGGGIATSELSTQDIVADIIENGGVTFSDDAIKINDDEGTSGKYSFAGNVINLFDATGEKQAIGFTNSDGGKLDVSKASDNYLLVGNYYDDKYGGSTLTGGKGNDTLLGGEGDVLNAGAGNGNRIILQDDDNRAGADIILTSGKTTVENFKSGFEDGDRLFFGVNDIIDFKFDGENVSVQTNDAWHGVLSGVADGADFVNILSADANAPIKVAIAQENAVIAVEDELADFYVGENSAVDFTNYDGELMLNLGSEEESLGTGEVLFEGINQITAGSGQTTLMGSAKNETLYAGTGTASLYGGGGKNLLANTADDKDSATTFFVLGDADGARNTIEGFAFVTADGIADKIEIDTAKNIVSGVNVSGDDVIINVSNRAGSATERAVISGAVGQNMQFSDNVIAQVNTTALTYDGTANYFVATGKNAGISVGADVSGKAAIWLGNENFVGDIRTLDATASDVKAELAGNDTNNTIRAGQGDSSLWGGNGGDDFMQGGAGKNTFFYTNGNGSDTISGTNEGDIVFLSQVTLDQIVSTGVTNNVATINFADGGKLTINDASNASYVMTQGDQAQTYKVSGDSFVNA